MPLKTKTQSKTLKKIAKRIVKPTKHKAKQKVKPIKHKAKLKAKHRKHKVKQTSKHTKPTVKHIHFACKTSNSNEYISPRILLINISIISQTKKTSI